MGFVVGCRLSDACNQAVIPSVSRGIWGAGGAQSPVWRPTRPDPSTPLGMTKLWHFAVTVAYCPTPDARRPLSAARALRSWSHSMTYVWIILGTLFVTLVIQNLVTGE